MAHGTVTACLDSHEIEMSVNICVLDTVALLPFCEALALSPEDISKMHPYGFSAEDVKEILEYAAADGYGVMKPAEDKYFIGNVIVL